MRIHFDDKSIVELIEHSYYIALHDIDTSFQFGFHFARMLNKNEIDFSENYIVENRVQIVRLNLIKILNHLI